MELRAIIAVNAEKNGENFIAYLESLKKEIEIIFLTDEEFWGTGWKAILEKRTISMEEVLVLCTSDEEFERSIELGCAKLACALEGEAYNFPSAKLVATGIEYYDRERLLKAYQREKRLPWEILQTKRLLVREETPADVERLYEIYESPSVKQFLEPLFEREREKEYLKNYYDYIYTFYEYGMWHLVLKESGIGIGRAGITPKVYDDGAQGAELGYLIDEAYQGQGYCMEACTAIIQYAKEELELDVLYCLIRPENERSLSICEALGFVYEKDIFEEERWMRRYIKKLHL